MLKTAKKINMELPFDRLHFHSTSVVCLPWQLFAQMHCITQITTHYRKLVQDITAPSNQGLFALKLFDMHLLCNKHAQHLPQVAEHQFMTTSIHDMH